VFLFLSLLLAMACVLPGSAKVLAHPKMRKSAAHFRIPWPGYRLIGVAELAGGATAIKVPVPQPKRDHVRRPDHPAGGQQPGRVMREQLVTGQDVHHQPDGGQQAHHSDKRDDQAGDDPQPSSLPVDPARVPGEISTASSASSTTGTTQAGCTRYRPGSATCRPATTMIALATGHQCSPRSAAGAIPAAGWRAGFRHVAILHDDRAEREPGPSCPGDLPSAVRAARWGQSRAHENKRQAQCPDRSGFGRARRLARDPAPARRSRGHGTSAAQHPAGLTKVRAAVDGADRRPVSGAGDDDG
jgi:hypothetical protein